MSSTIPRFMASSASSRRLQCVTGLPDSSEGASHARATIWQTCSGVKVGGAPLRGRSAKTSSSMHRLSVLSPASSCAARRRCVPSNQALRHKRAVSRLSPSSLAICSLLAPSAAARTMRARRASLWVVVARRVRWTSILRWRSVRVIDGGSGPGIAVSVSWGMRGDFTPLSNLV
jgi:hypothetical protein